MASSDDDFNKLDTLSDSDYLKLIEIFYEKVRGKCSVLTFLILLFCLDLECE